MDLHNQVTSPELSNKLHQIGLTAPSVFCRDWTGAKPDEIEYDKNFEPYYCEDNVNCYTASELGNLLPPGYQSNRVGPLSNNPAQKQYEWRSWHLTLDSCFFADTEADARAKMLIYLIENNLVVLSRFDGSVSLL
jgi:hypothetical protein